MHAAVAQDGRAHEVGRDLVGAELREPAVLAQVRSIEFGGLEPRTAGCERADSRRVPEGEQPPLNPPVGIGAVCRCEAVQLGGELGVRSVEPARVLGIERPVAREVLARVRDARRILDQVPLFPRPHEEPAGSDAAARANEAWRVPAESRPPVALRPEQGAIVGEDELVDEQIALVDEVRPQVRDAVVEARLPVDVQEGEHDRLLVMRQRVAKPSLSEVTALERPEPPDVLLHLVDIGHEQPRCLGLGVAVPRLRRGQALERVVDHETAADDVADQRQVRGRAPVPAAALDHHPFHLGRNLDQLEAIARCALYEVPVVTSRVVRHIRRASRSLRLQPKS